MNNLEDIVSLCKRRGFIYQGSEIYGGMAGLYDFGPYGVELLNNLKRNWWYHSVIISCMRVVVVFLYFSVRRVIINL